MIIKLTSKYANKLLNNMLDAVKVLLAFVATQRLNKMLIKSCLQRQVLLLNRAQ
jgi:hypothetical protein